MIIYLFILYIIIMFLFCVDRCVYIIIIVIQIYVGILNDIHVDYILCVVILFLSL